MALTAEPVGLKESLKGSGWLFLGLLLLFFVLGSIAIQSTDETDMLKVAQGLAHFQWHGLFRSTFGIGTSLLEVPFLWLGAGARRLTPGFEPLTAWICLFLMPPVLGAASGVLTWMLARTVGQTPRHAAVAVLCFSVGSFAVVYQTRLFSEGGQTVALLVAVVFVLQFQRTRTPRLLYVAGFALGWLFMLKPATAVISAPFLVLLPWQLTRMQPIAARVGAIARILVAALPGAIVVLMYNRLRFGSGLNLGDADPRSLEYGFHSGFITGLYGLILSPGGSLLVFMPVSAAGLFGILRLRQRLAFSAILTLGLPLAFIVFDAGWWSWHGGWCWGPRFLVPVTPLFALGVGELAWEDWPAGRRAALWALVGVSVVIQWPGLAVSSRDYVEHVAATCSKAFPAWRPGTATTPSGPVDDIVELHFVPAFSPPIGDTWLALERVFGDVAEAPWAGERLCERTKPRDKPLEWWWTYAARTETGVPRALAIGAAALLWALALVLLVRWRKEITATEDCP